MERATARQWKALTTAWWLFNMDGPSRCNRPWICLATARTAPRTAWHVPLDFRSAYLALSFRFIDLVSNDEFPCDWRSHCTRYRHLEKVFRECSTHWWHSSILFGLKIQLNKLLKAVEQCKSISMAPCSLGFHGASCRRYSNIKNTAAVIITLDFRKIHSHLLQMSPFNAFLYKAALFLVLWVLYFKEQLLKLHVAVREGNFYSTTWAA